MKFLILGDCHFRVRTPQCRTDENFMETCLDKLQQAMDVAHANECDAVLQVGDFFDSPNPSGELVAEVITSIRAKWRKPFYATHGQHDLTYHTEASMKRSTLRIMEAAGTTNSVGGYTRFGCKTSRIHGAAFGQIPPVPDNDRYFNILIAHTMVGDKPLWPGHDLTGPEEYVRKYPGYDLYCLGDYHYPFSVKVGDAWVINPGVLLRLTASERDMQHRPKVVIFDTDTNEPEDIYLDVKPASEAFDLSKKKEKRVEGPDFSAMVAQLKAAGRIGLSFRENLVRYLETKKVEKNVQEAVWNALEGV